MLDENLVALDGDPQKKPVDFHLQHDHAGSSAMHSKTLKKTDSYGEGDGEDDPPPGGHDRARDQVLSDEVAVNRDRAKVQ